MLDIAYIHSNKLAKWNYEYIGKDGTIYVGQKDGRLKKKEVAIPATTTSTTDLDVSLSWGNITGNILNQLDLIAYINTIIGAITLDGLADVTITAPAPGDVLTYDAVNNIWINAPGGVGVAVTTFSGGTTGLTPAAPTSGAVVLGGTLAVANGGTGLNALGAATNYLRVNAAGTALEYWPFPAIPSGTVTSVSASVPSPASPAYSVTVTNPTTTPAIAISALGTTSEYVRGDGSRATFPTIPTVTPSALTGNNDTNVTVTLTGSPSNALLQAVTMTMGWTGTLGIGRGGTGLGTTPTNGQILIGNGTGYTLATITPGTNITITNTPGGITINATVPPATTVTGRTGDINVVTSGSNYEVQNAVLPFLLMGC